MEKKYFKLSQAVLLTPMLVASINSAHAFTEDSDQCRDPIDCDGDGIPWWEDDNDFRYDENSDNQDDDSSDDNPDVDEPIDWIQGDEYPWDPAGDLAEECQLEQLETVRTDSESLFSDLVGAIETHQGRVRQTITDFNSGHDILPIKMERIYRSAGAIKGWQYTYSLELKFLDHIPTEIGRNTDTCGDELYRPVLVGRGLSGSRSLRTEKLHNGEIQWTDWEKNSYTNKAYMRKLPNGNYEYVDQELSRTEIYSPTGRILKVTDDASQISLVWDYQSNGKTRITRTGGMWMEIDQGAQGFTTQFSSGEQIDYRYNTKGAIDKVIYPDGNVITYEYKNVSGSKSLLTNEYHNGKQYAHFKYHNNGLVSEQTIGTSGTTRFAYRKLSNSEKEATMTNPKGRVVTFRSKLGDVTRVTGSGGGLPSTETNRTFEYNRLKTETNHLGVKKSYDYNSEGWETKITEAAGTADETYVKTTWDSVRKLPITVETPKSLTTYTYTSSTRPLLKTKSTKDKQSGIERKLSYSYLYHSNGLVSRMQIDGPRADVNDVSYEYYDSLGRMTKSVNANGDATLFQSFDAMGRARVTVFPDGSKVTVAFNVRGMKKSETLSNSFGSKTTAYEYDLMANPIKVTDPSGVVTERKFDEGYRLKEQVIGNKLSEKYSYDALSKLAKVEKSDIVPTGVPIGEESCEIRDSEEFNCHTYTEEDAYEYHRKYLKERATDALGRLQDDKYPGGVTTKHHYDNLSRVSKVVSPSGAQLVKYTYDKLDRVKTKTDATGRVTEYSYDAENNVINIEDNANRNFAYDFNGFGEKTQAVSPVSGTNLYDYDSAGNLKRQTYEDGTYVSLEYDALNRIKKRTLSTGDVHTFTYDRYAQEKGLLGKVTDASGSTEYRYQNVHRQLSNAKYVIESSNYNLSYTYDNSGNVSSITYPSGYKVTYVRDASTSEVTSIKGNGTNLIYNINNVPFGDVRSYNYGAAKTATYNYDSNYKPKSVEADWIDLDFTYNADQMVQRKANSQYSTETLSYTYHPDQTLKTQSGSLRNENYQYDELMNRKTLTQNSTGVSKSYQYDSQKRLIGMNNDNSVKYDARGNITEDKHHGSDSSRSFNALNQLTSVTMTSQGSSGGGGIILPPSGGGWCGRVICFDPLMAVGPNKSFNSGNTPLMFNSNQSSEPPSGTTYLKYNALGHRTVKSGPLGHFHFIYDANGRLMAESKNGVITKEYIYLGDRLIALKRENVTDFVFTDNLLRPEVVVSSFGHLRWRAFNHAFGREVKTDIIQGLNLGFPGQYYDAEFDTWYNMRRDYDAVTGRYLQSDPLGTIDGPNTYVYTGNNPVNRTDPTGEFWQVLSVAVTLGEIAYELHQNGGDLSKINWTEKAVGAVTGGVFTKIATKAGKSLHAVYKGSKRSSAAKTEVTGSKSIPCALECFVAGTEVLTKTGYVNIEDIKVGDLVWAKNIETGVYEWKPVTATRIIADKKIYRVSVLTLSGEVQTIRATSSHPFWVKDEGWLDTVELQPGHMLEDKEGNSLQVISVEDTGSRDTAYNFTVDDYHTYYVTQQNVLVHNCGATKGERSLSQTTRPDVPEKKAIDVLDKTPKKLRQQVFDIMEQLPNALKNRGANRTFFNSRRDHELTGNLRGWRSLDLVPGRPGLAGSKFRFLYKETKDGVEYMVRDTH